MHALTRVSLKNRLLVGLVTLAVAAFGLLSLTSLRQELMPATQDTATYIDIRADGLSPDQMAERVLTPLEQALKSVPVITSITSSASATTGNILLGWPYEQDLARTYDEIQAAVNTVRPQLPESTKVEVYTGGSGGLPAVQLSAATSGDQAAFITQLEKSVVPALRAVPGVQSATLSGQHEQEVRISLRQDDVTRLRVDTAQLQPALKANEQALAAGQTPSDTGPIAVSVGTALQAVDDIAAIPVHAEEHPVPIHDFADVALETVPGSSVSRINGKAALTLSVVPAPGANVVSISHGVTEVLDQATPELGAGAEFVTLFDQAPFIEQSIKDLSVEGGLGLLFAVLVILAFLWSFRPTLIAAISIPLSLLITMIGLQITENTLNILTLGALTIAVGRVVDDSIVVIENIKRRQGTGELTLTGVLRSVQQVAGAITASTLTTVAVFLPIVFLSGVVGQLFRPFALTVSLALLSSLLVALTIVPVLAYWLLRGRSPALSAESAAVEAEPRELTPRAPVTPTTADHPMSPSSELEQGTSEALISEEAAAPEDRLQRAFLPALAATKRRSKLTVGISVGILVATLYGATLIPIDFFGDSGQQSLSVTQQLPEYRSLEERTEAAQPVEEVLAAVPGVATTMTSIERLSTTPGEAPTSNFTVLLEDGVLPREVTPKITRALDQLQDLGKLQLDTTDSNAIGGSTIDLNILGDDPVALEEAARTIEEQLAGKPGVGSISNTLQGEEKTLRVSVDRAKAAAVGYDQSSVAAAIDAALEGTTVGTVTIAGAERPIRIAATAPDTAPDQLGALLLPVTATQTAQSQQAMSDEIAEAGKRKVEEAQQKTDRQLRDQLGEAQKNRATAVQQLADLRRQLHQLNATPLTVLSPEEAPEAGPEAAAAAAAAERAQQVAALTEGIAQAEQAVTGTNEQIVAVQDSQRAQAEGLVEQARLEEEQRTLKRLLGTPIPVSAIASVGEELVAGTISRKNGVRVVTVSVTPEEGMLMEATNAATLVTEQTELPTGIRFEVTGLSADQEEAFSQLGVALVAAVVLVLLVMVATFRSFRQPLILLVSVPFAASGALAALLITNTALGLPALIGLLMLIGIVVTNAIVLLDLINRLLRGGLPLEEAVHHGTRLRLRPILMTAAATIFALLPMALGLTGGGVFISKALAIVVIGGLVSSTLLTIVLVPILFLFFERRAIRKQEKRRARQARLRLGEGWDRLLEENSPELAAGSESPGTVPVSHRAHRGENDVPGRTESLRAQLGLPELPVADREQPPRQKRRWWGNRRGAQKASTAQGHAVPSPPQGESGSPAGDSSQGDHRSADELSEDDPSGEGSPS